MKSKVAKEKQPATATGALGGMALLAAIIFCVGMLALSGGGGWQAFLGCLLPGEVFCAVGFAVLLPDAMKERKKEERLTTKKKVAELEGAVGVPLLMEGEKACPRCQAPLVLGAKFCTHCGQSTEERVCGVCGARNPVDAQFCHECATELVGKTKPTRYTARP